MRKPIKTIELNSAISLELFTNGGINKWIVNNFGQKVGQNILFPSS